MPKVYLIRHAETQETREDRFFWPLSDRGEEQAHAIAGAPFWDEIQAIISSDESKAIATVSHIVHERRIPLFYDPRLRELKRPDERVEDYEARVLEVFQKPAMTVGGWERAVDAQARMIACFEEMVARYGETPFAMVSHGMTLALLIATLQNTVGYAFDIWQTLGFGTVVLVERDERPAGAAAV